MRIDSIPNNEVFEKTRSELENELKRRTKVSPLVEKVIFVGLTNRTNTGALATTLGRSPIERGITRHIQPFKAIARNIMTSQGVDTVTPLKFFKDEIELDAGVHLIKETIGPDRNNPAEWIDALKILENSGLSLSMLSFIPTFRDPLDTIASWRRMWKWSIEDFPFDVFNKSLRFVSDKIAILRSMGVPVVPYVHEFVRDFGAEVVVKRICSKLDIPFSQHMIEWDNGVDPYFSGNLIKYDQPPDQWIQGALSRDKGGRGGLVWKPVSDEWQLTKREKTFISAQIGPALEIHQEQVENALRILKLK